VRNTPRAPSTPTLAQWLETPAGRYVLAWETVAVSRAVTDVFGYYAVQIGLPGTPFLNDNRMPTRLVLDDATLLPSTTPSPALRALAHELPLASQSVDLVVLPHLLEFADEPHDILREVERVLRPEGQLIVTGFNPYSLWGIKRTFDRDTAPPWNSEFISLYRMRDWLKLLNFEIKPPQLGCYRPPFESDPWLARFGFAERWGARWWPFGGAAYVLHAAKRVQGMRLIGPKWQRQRVRAGVARPVAQANAPQTIHAPQRESIIYHERAR
jgi:SAM-dependent methyltransferase